MDKVKLIKCRTKQETVELSINIDGKEKWLCLSTDEFIEIVDCESLVFVGGKLMCIDNFGL